ncbi:MAG: folylpolyglutamate synthase/dihydrofolate synthase family protein [Elusimicrobiota bacterium]
MTFAEALRYLDFKKESRIFLGLERVRSFLDRLGNPEAGLRVIHVAGTNAKGSVCRMLFEIFKETGLRPGLYTSPHLDHIAERIETVGGLIPESDFASLTERLIRISGHEELSYFEFITVLAFLYFQEVRADPVILETGLGGRLDATNVLSRPLISVITTIGLDHMGWLGASIESIANEKGGIIKDDVPVAIGRLGITAKNVIREMAKKRGSELTEPELGAIETKVFWDLGYQLVQWGGRFWRLDLLGRHQAQNLALTISALERLRRVGIEVSQSAFEPALRRLRMPGRWERIMVDARPWVFDVAHNAQAVEAFLACLRESPWSVVKPKRAIVGFLRDKDYSAMLAMLASCFDEFYVTPLESDRSCSVEELREVLLKQGFHSIREFSNVEAAVREAMAGPASFTAVLGSFRLVAPARSYLLPGLTQASKISVQ